MKKNYPNITNINDLRDLLKQSNNNFFCDQDRATYTDNKDNRIFREDTVISCTPVTTSQDLASPSLGSQKKVSIADKAIMPQGFKSIKYDLYDNADPDLDKRKLSLSINTLTPNSSFKAACNSQYRFFKRGIEDIVNHPHYQQIMELYQELNDGTNDVLRLAKCYVNFGKPNRPNMQTVTYQSVILQKKNWGDWFVWHQNEDQLHFCHLMTEQEIEFTEAQKRTPLIATGWIKGDLAQQKRYTLKDISKKTPSARDIFKD